MEPTVERPPGCLGTFPVNRTDGNPAHALFGYTPSKKTALQCRTCSAGRVGVAGGYRRRSRVRRVCNRSGSRALHIRCRGGGVSQLLVEHRASSRAEFVCRRCPHTFPRTLIGISLIIRLRSITRNARRTSRMCSPQPAPTLWFRWKPSNGHRQPLRQRQRRRLQSRRCASQGGMLPRTTAAAMHIAFVDTTRALTAVSATTVVFPSHRTGI